MRISVMLLMILCPLIGISAATHLMVIRKRILECSSERDKIASIFKKMLTPFSAKKIKSELLDAGGNKRLIGLFFRWMLFYRLIFLSLMLFVLFL